MRNANPISDGKNGIKARENYKDETIGDGIKVTVFAIGAKYEKPFWFENIFCQVENQVLMSGLESSAKEINCNIYYGDQDSPDILACGHFVSVVDRGLVGEECWKYFLECCKETYDDTSCIIVDKLHYLGKPDHKNLKFVDLNNPRAFEEIKSTIRKIRL